MSLGIPGKEASGKAKMFNIVQIHKNIYVLLTQ